MKKGAARMPDGSPDRSFLLGPTSLSQPAERRGIPPHRFQDFAWDAHEQAAEGGETLLDGIKDRGTVAETIVEERAMGQVIPFPQRGKQGGRTSRKPAAKIPAQNKPTKKFTILIVEDHGSLRDIVSIYLMRQGYHIRTAGNGQAALDILATEKIHILLLDLMLPAVDGFEVLRQLQEQKRQSSPYVIVVTALTAESEKERVLKLGGDEYLPKPFHLPHLLERIQAAEDQLSTYVQL